MRAVGIKVLKNRLSEYIRLVASTGETVLVTDRDRVVAELRPPSPTRSQDVSDAVTDDLVRRGLMTPPSASGPPPDPPRTSITLDEILADLAVDREDRV